MSRYEIHSIVSNESTSKMSVDIFSSIERLDKYSTKLTRQIDLAVRILSTTTGDNQRLLEKISLLRQAIEAISLQKVHLVVKSYDFIDQNIRMVDDEITILEKALSTGESAPLAPAPLVVPVDQPKRPGRKRKYEREDITQQLAVVVDPNEPVYCTCQRIAFGEMIACDNEDCLVEWFHYGCVNLTRKPRNSWICPACSHKRKRFNS